MSMLAKRRMTVDEFLVWAEGQEGRCELDNEGAEAAQIAPSRFQSSHPGRGGLASAAPFDETVKLNGCFSLASVQHYLIVDPEGPPVIHHRREADGKISRSVVHEAR